jgi:hypothetical protein
MFLFSAGHVGASKTSFVILRAAGPGDNVVALTAFSIYVHQLKRKYSQLHEFDYKAVKQTLLRNFWIFFTVYGLLWVALCAVSVFKADM